MVEKITFSITPILLETSKTSENQTKLIIYAILIMIFLGLALLFGYLYYKLRDDDSPTIKMTHKNIKKYLSENRKKIVGGFFVTCFVIIVGLLSLMITLI